MLASLIRPQFLYFQFQAQLPNQHAHATLVHCQPVVLHRRLGLEQEFLAYSDQSFFVKRTATSDQFAVYGTEPTLSRSFHIAVAQQRAVEIEEYSSYFSH